MIRGFLTSAGRAFSLIFLFRGSQFLGVVWQKACVSQQGAFWGVMCTYKKTVYIIHCIMQNTTHAFIYKYVLVRAFKKYVICMVNLATPDS